MSTIDWLVIAGYFAVLGGVVWFKSRVIRVAAIHYIFRGRFGGYGITPSGLPEHDDCGGPEAVVFRNCELPRLDIFNGQEQLPDCMPANRIRQLAKDHFSRIQFFSPEGLESRYEYS